MNAQMTLLLLLLLVTPTEGADAVSEPTRSIVVTSQNPGPRVAFHIIYYDDSYLFLATDYSDPGEPAFYVHSKKLDRWRIISQISTKDAIFGSSRGPAFEGVNRLPVDWDYRSYTNKPFAELPLKTSGSVNHPDKMELEAGKHRYKVSFNTEPAR